MPVGSLLYGGNTTKVYIHLQPWFHVCHTSATAFPVGTDSNNNGQLDRSEFQRCNGHIEVGYNSDDPATVDAQINSMTARGFDGVEINWYGKPTATCAPSNNSDSRCVEDTTTRLYRDNLAARCGAGGCPFLLTLDFDQGMFTQGSNQCASDSTEPSCIATRLKAAFDHANTTYFGSPAYLKQGGRPVVSFFIAESTVIGSTQCTTGSPCQSPTTAVTPNGTCTSQSNCWEAIWRSVRAHVQGFSNGNPLFMFRNAGAFNHVQTDGGFAWTNHNNPACDGTANRPTNNDVLGLCYLDNFYETAVTHPSLTPWGAAWRGADDVAATWGDDVVTPQRCGQTFLLTMLEENYNGNGGYGGSTAYYSTSRQLPYMKVVTWNDYDEGTAIEPGIDNCQAISASVSGSTLSWTLDQAGDQPNAATYRSETTVDHYEVFDSSDGQNLTLAATIPAGGQHSVDLGSLDLGPGTRTLYVKAVGKPSILNHLSNAVTYTPAANRFVTITTPTDGSDVLSPVHVVASATSPNTVTLSQIYLNGTKVYEVHSAQVDTDITMTQAGSNRLTVQSYDAGGTFKKTIYVNNCVLNPTARTVTICTPQDGATVTSPVRVLAGTTAGSSPVTLVQIYLDGVKVYEVADDRLDTTISIGGSGSHRLTVQAYDSSGTFKTTIFVTT
ncbi:MAG: Ig-like domain-containing protein [Mycobacteriales bacterium]